MDTSFLLLAVLSSGPMAAQENSDQTTTFFIVRHADRQGEDDAITPAGKKRAEELRDFMVRQQVRAIYSTNTNRTVSTATPTAKATGIAITKYQDVGNGRYRPIPTPAWYQELIRKHRGQSVLIVGHSNTIVRIANGLGGRIRHKVGEDEYHSMFVVAVAGENAQVVRINYGAVPARPKKAAAGVSKP